MSHLLYEVAKVHIDDLHREADAARLAALASAAGPGPARPHRVWRPRLALIRRRSGGRSARTATSVTS